MGLAVLALPCLLYSMDLTVLHLAAPALVADLQPDAAQLLWIIDIYGFLLAAALLPMGVLGDRFGRRRMLLIGAAAFAVTSVIAGAATSPEQLIAARAGMGIAAATLAPSTLSLIRNMFTDPAQRTLAIGVWVASFSAGAAIGPLVGGILLTYFSWGSVFLIPVPVMVILLVVGPLLLPEYRDIDAAPIDLLSVLLSIAAVLAVVYAVKETAVQGPGLAALFLGVGGLALGWMFVRRQRSARHPLIDLDLLSTPRFGAMLLVYTSVFFVNFVALFLVAQYFQLVLEMPPLTAGLWTIPSAVGFIAASLATPLLARRVASRTLIIGGLVIASGGFLGLAAVGIVTEIWLPVVGSVVFSIGLSPAVTLATDLIIGSVPPERAGMASGLSEAGSELGGALGIAVIGSAAAVVYRLIVGRTPLTGITDRELEEAQQSLGSAIVIADRLSDATGPALVSAAQAAFSSAAAVSFALCGISTSIIALATQRRLRRTSESNAGADSEAGHRRSSR